MKMKVQKMSKRFWDDADWVEKHYSELADKYPDQWVAVVDKKVVSFGKDGRKVEETAKTKTKRDEIYMTYAECGKHVYSACTK